MPLGPLAQLTRREFVRAGILVAVVAAACVWISFQLWQPAPPRRIVIASGTEAGLYHRHAQRYKELLAREGVTVEERMTAGAGENYRLLLDPNSGVDVAFMQGGIATFPEADGLVMIASLYYEVLWVFYRGGETLDALNEVRGKRVAVGAPGSGTRSLVLPLLQLNGVTGDNATILDIGGTDALRALKDGQVDVAMLVGGARTPMILDALRDPALKLMSFERAAAYPRRFRYLTRVTLPPGTVDFARNVPQHELELIATKAMLAARDDLHPALTNLLLDSVQDVHDDQDYFEAAGEFPATAQVDLKVAPGAERHRRFGPTLLHRYLPFWVATLVERIVIVVVPLLVVLVPLVNFLPQFVRWRVRSRVYRWYGELALLERDVASRRGELPIEKWLHDLDRIERAVEGIRMPPSFASEAYTLREHVGLVRRAVIAKAGTPTLPAQVVRKPPP